MGKILPFTQHEAFDPETTHVMALAFDGAWNSLRNTGHIGTAPFKAEATREHLAKRILELAQRGDRDPIRLQDYAVKGLTPSRE
jgi:hypothetical protein